MKPSNDRASFTAIWHGQKIEVFISMDNSLWAWLEPRDAWLYDLEPGQNVLARDPVECTRWIKTHVPRGPEQERWLEYFGWRDWPGFLKQRQEQEEAVTVRLEEEQRAAQILYWERLKQQEEASWAEPDILSSGNQESIP